MQKTIFLLLLSSALFGAPCAPENCVYLPSARTDSNFSVSLDFLYWEGTERGLEFALNNSGSFFNQSIVVAEPDFKFEPAFRLGIGTGLPHDNWDLAFLYTRFYTRTEDHARNGIHSVWTSSIAFQGNNFRALWENGSGKWKLHSNFFDLLLKNRLRISSAIAIEPAFGLKLALLQQRFTVLYENGNAGFITSRIAMKNHSFNLGPTFGLTSRWTLFNHFDLLGTISGSLLASHFNVGRNEFNVGLNTIDSIREGNIFWASRPQVALSFGFGWDDCSCSVHYGLSAAYEAQVWWKQNMLFRYIDQTNAAMIAPTQGNLFFHGLSLEGFVEY